MCNSCKLKMEVRRVHTGSFSLFCEAGREVGVGLGLEDDRWNGPLWETGGPAGDSGKDRWAAGGPVPTRVIQGTSGWLRWLSG